MIGAVTRFIDRLHMNGNKIKRLSGTRSKIYNGRMREGPRIDSYESDPVSPPPCIKALRTMAIRGVFIAIQIQSKV